ncbi:hypothetical protein K5549_014124 [Capra hircus]|nr:hypothetical protein K5549_014124 [Capra hircus]
MLQPRFLKFIQIDVKAIERQFHFYGGLNDFTASKACVVKREFKKAEQLIKHAVYLARDHFGSKHPKYSDTLLDYGFYLFNVDNICQSVAIY